jgi:hypothetical protein
VIYFICYPDGDRSKLTVVDLHPAVAYERDEIDTLNSRNYDSALEAMDECRDIADRFGLAYVLFKSRYDSSLDEEAS